MKRSSFFKTLATLVAAPKILGEINFDKLAASNIAESTAASTRTLISDLQLLTPHYYKRMIEKYGNESCDMMLHFLNSTK